jgi:guanine nucleotide-binding protein G(I)/G(S)/G(T) subunit beta-1
MDSEQDQKLKAEIASLKETLKRAKEANKTGSLAKASDSIPAVTTTSLKLRRTLKGHLAKIYAMQWSEESPTLASASQDGKLLVWNAVTCLKMNAINLPSNWVMTCGYSPSGEFVASGGLDNTCSVWNVRGQNPTKVSRELQGHDGFLSCCRFIDNRQIITSSGDHTCALWDVEGATQSTVYRMHTADVMFVALNKSKDTFVSCGCDYRAIAWDIKSGKATHLFDESESDVNTVTFFPNDHTFAAGTEDGHILLYDLRTWTELNRFTLGDANQAIAPTSIAFSQSGRLMFASYTDAPCTIWDTLKGDRKGELRNAHEKRISSIGVSGDGNALCTASWDSFMKIWT